MGSNSGPLFFWREFEEPYGFLSQWYEDPFEAEGVTYQSAEMWMMVQKARLFGDKETADKMMETTEPSEHKALGRKAKGFNRAQWDQHKSRIVEEGNYHKFTSSKSNPGMARKLLDTGDRELVEASPEDRIWGVGFGAADAEQHRNEWGENLLGLALMNVREKLRKEGR